MKEEDKKRIEANAFAYACSKDGGYLELIAFNDGATAECEYWQSKLKERDELLSQMHRLLLEAKTRFENPIISTNYVARLRQFLLEYENLKAK